MKMFELLAEQDHEQVVFCQDREIGLKAIIAIHDTTLGPALGGTRMWNYQSTADALRDVLRLSRAMTYKAAAAGLNLGGGKAVIIGDPNKDKNEILFRAYGRFVEALGGHYITAEDVGTSVYDMEWIRMETQYVTGVLGPGGSGDPSPFTAYGVYHGMKASTKYKFGSDSLSNRTIAIQGAGHVASHLAEYLTKEGAKVYITDIYREKAEKVCDATGAIYVDPEAIYDVECDIFCPAALGGVINPRTIPRLKCSIVAGAANNQLEDEDRDSQLLAERDILYAPDYVINAGGLINVATELEGYNKERALRRVETIYNTLLNIYQKAEAENMLPLQAANRLAEERIAKVARIHRHYTGHPRIHRV